MQAMPQSALPFTDASCRACQGGSRSSTSLGNLAGRPGPKQLRCSDLL